LLPVQQAVFAAASAHVEAVGLQIFGNIGVDQPDLAVLGVGIRLAIVVLPLRIDFTSVPVSAMPVSMVSSIA